MKQKGLGGYQIIDFEGQAPSTIDASFVKRCLEKGKPLWVNNLVVDGETYSGVASGKITALAIVLTLATLTITIALADGATTYEEIGGSDIYKLEITLGSTLSDSDKLKVTEAMNSNKEIILISNTYYDLNMDDWNDGVFIAPMTRTNEDVDDDIKPMISLAYADNGVIFLLKISADGSVTKSYHSL